MRLVQALRAAITLGVGIYITFSQAHSAAVGLLALAIFGLGVGSVLAIFPAFRVRGLQAIEHLPVAVLAILIGGFAALAPLQESTITSAAAFIALVTAWGLLAGSFELYQARRKNWRKREGRDHLITAVFSLLLGALFLAVDLDIVSAVGFFGAYLALSGVHLGIAAAEGEPAS
jgi:peptidoglycan/LPS O-acetylase OafA/YrhL